MSVLYEKIRKIIKERSGDEALSPVLEALSNIHAEVLTPFEMQRFKALVSEVMLETITALTKYSQMQVSSMPLHDKEQHVVSGTYNHCEKNHVTINYLKFKYPDFIHERNLDEVELIEISDDIPRTTEYSIIKARYRDGREEYATGTRLPSDQNTPSHGYPIHFSTMSNDLKSMPYFVKTMENGHKIIRVESSVQHHIETLLKNLQIIQRLSEKFQGVS